MNVLVFGESLISLLSTISLRVLIVAILAGLLIKLYRTKNAAILHFAWTTILIGMLLFPIVFLLVPYVHIALLPGAARLPIANPQPSHSYWVQLMAAVYLSGLAASLIRLATGLLSVKKLIRNSQIISSSKLDFQLNQIGPTGLKKLPILLCHRAVRTPVTIGYFRPHIILPTDWTKWSEAKIRSVLAHEIAHINRADYLLRILALLNQCFYWFHPLAWHLSRHLSLLSEKICDQKAVEFGGNKREYAKHLFEIAAQGSTRKAPAELCGLAMAKRRSQLAQRIEAVLSAESQSVARTSRTILLISLVAGFCWFAAASLCF